MAESAQRMHDQRRILELIEAWADAVRHQDIAGVVANHADDLLVYDVVPPLFVRGLDAYRYAWETQFFPWAVPGGGFTLHKVEVTCGDRVAFATALIDCMGRERGRPVAYILRLTVGLEKREGVWCVVHEHHSEPVPADTA